MTTYRSAQAFLNDLYEVIRSNNYEAGLKLLEAHRDLPMDQLNQLTLILWMYNRMCIYTHFGHVDEALAAFQEAIDRGFWYSPEQLSGDEDLKPLKGNPRYEELCEISMARYEKIASEIQPKLDVYPPANGTDKPSLLMALHGNISSAALSYDNWKVATDCGRLLAMPTSSHLFIEGGYLWNDFATAEAEIKQHYETLKAQYDLDVEQTIVGGYITGGSLAIWATLNQFFPIKGFIVIGSSIIDLDDWVSRLDGLKGTGVRGYVLLGEEDTSIFENVTTFVKEMHRRGMPCELDIRAGLGHDDIPDDFDETLKRALDFVSQ